MFLILFSSFGSRRTHVAGELSSVARRAAAIILVAGSMGFGVVSAQTTPNGPASVNARVTAAGVYGNGAAYVFFDQAITSCSTASRFDLDPTNPSLKYVLATAYAAIATNKLVGVHPAQCSGSSVVWSVDSASYIYLIN
jgi:hypothetical protein